MAPSPVPKSVPVVLGVVFCDACNQFLIFPFIPFLVRDQLELAADDPNVPLYSGLLAAAYLFGQFVCSPFYGNMSEKLGRRPVLLVCVVISTLFLLAFGFSANYWLSVTLRLLQGAFAGALTVGKLYLADVADTTNEGKIFSFIGIAIGTGCITGPAVGGYLADPKIVELVVPRGSSADLVVRSFPYLAPCLAGALISIGVFLSALLSLPESRPPTMQLFGKRVSRVSSSSSGFGQQQQQQQLGKPLLPNAQPGASDVRRSSAASMPVGGVAIGGVAIGGVTGAPTLAHVASSGSLLEAMIVMDDGTEAGGGGGGEETGSGPSSDGPSSRASPAPGGASPQPVSAVSLALKHSLSPKPQRANLFQRSRSLSPVPSAASGMSGNATVLRIDAEATSVHAGGGGAAGGGGGADDVEQRRRLVFWTVQLACFLFALTNVGLTEVLPVWLSTPPTTGPDDFWSSGLGLSPSLIGNLQSTTGVGNIVLALFVTFRIINGLGPVRTFAMSLFINAGAAFGPPLIKLLGDGCPESFALGIMCVSYSLVAASRNMMFATAIMLSKEAAAGGPGVAIGINQSACSLGSAFGPMLTGFVYTQALSSLRTCLPFFVSVGVIGALPGVLLVMTVPPWPWKWNAV